MQGATDAAGGSTRKAGGLAAPLVAPLFEGPIDVVGDVHGECGALFQLLDRLGYDGEGNHLEGRRLVFVGDLVDRGPDSVRVVDFVRKLHSKGRAQMVLGNHELNLMRGDRKHGNHWWWGETEVIRKDKQALSFQTLPPDDAWRSSTLAWLASLPLVLERGEGASGVRVVHASWDAGLVDELRVFSGTPVAAYRHFTSKMEREVGVKWEAPVGCDDAETKPSKPPDAALDAEVKLQNGNAVTVTVCGKEEKVDAPFFSGGKWRWIDRQKWWRTYQEDEMVIFGHYWRLCDRPESTPTSFAAFSPTGGNLFADMQGVLAVGPKSNCVCVDFSVGVRYEERGFKLPPGAFGTKLGALRLPEREVIFEDGLSLSLPLPLPPPLPLPLPLPQLPPHPAEMAPTPAEMAPMATPALEAVVPQACEMENGAADGSCRSQLILLGESILQLASSEQKPP